MEVVLAPKALSVAPAIMAIPSIALAQTEEVPFSVAVTGATSSVFLSPALLLVTGPQGGYICYMSVDDKTESFFRQTINGVTPSPGYPPPSAVCFSADIVQ